jgi:hypothetical protein
VAAAVVTVVHLAVDRKALKSVFRFLVSTGEVLGLDEIDVAARGLPANQAFTVYASDGTNELALMDVTSNDLMPDTLTDLQTVHLGQHQIEHY